mmetsp:Transcript_99552/g.278788  ORF Transcript_99552/g.278788 Transcript_99552/m.278788 type:complete len:166 (-) Transcript_99552:563-1060(-)
MNFARDSCRQDGDMGGKKFGGLRRDPYRRLARRDSSFGTTRTSLAIGIDFGASIRITAFDFERKGLGNERIFFAWHMMGSGFGTTSTDCCCCCSIDMIELLNDFLANLFGTALDVNGAKKIAVTGDRTRIELQVTRFHTSRLICGWCMTQECLNQLIVRDMGWNF